METEISLQWYLKNKCDVIAGYYFNKRGMASSIIAINLFLVHLFGEFNLTSLIGYFLLLHLLQDE